MMRVKGMGRLVDDVTLRTTPSGVSVANFTIASQRNRKDANGEYQADFIDCVAWRGLAEFLANYTAKGSRIDVDGRLETRTYESKEGRTVKVTEIQVDNVEVIDWKRSRQEDGGQKKKSNDPFAGEGGEITINDDDLPF